MLGELAVVTGGASGIGRAVMKAFVSQGAKVAAVDYNAGLVKESVAELTTKGFAPETEAAAFTADVSDSSALKTLMQDIGNHFDQVPKYCVNCAGITRDKFLLKMEEEDFDQVIKVNLKGTFLMTQVFAKYLVEKQQPGSVVNVSSIIGKVGNLGQANYAASKAGVVGFSKTAAKEFAQFGIRCNVVVPGFIDTPMVSSVPDKVLEKMQQMIPLGRVGKPEEVAEVCLFLASDKSSYITGTCIEVTGGLFM